MHIFFELLNFLNPRQIPFYVFPFTWYERTLHFQIGICIVWYVSNERKHWRGVFHREHILFCLYAILNIKKNNCMQSTSFSTHDDDKHGSALIDSFFFFFLFFACSQFSIQIFHLEVLSFRVHNFPQWI